MDKSEMKRLLTMLKSVSDEERETGIESLTEYCKKEPELLNEIHKLINKGKELERQAAYEIVGQVQNESSIPILLKKLTDKDPTIREHTSNTIVKFEKPPKSLISGLKQLLFHKRGEVRLRILTIIGELKIEETLDDLFSIVRKERTDQPYVTQEIYTVLGKLKSLRAVPILLEDISSNERNNALQEITERHGKEKVDIFREKKVEKLENVPEEFLSDPELIDALLEGINSTEDNVRINSLFLYCKIADDNQFDLIRTKLQDSNPEIRRITLKWLAQYERKESGEDLVRSLGDAEVTSTASMLLEDTKWVETLSTEGLKSQNPEIRGNSAAILAKLNDKSVVPKFVEALYSEDVDETKISFAEALGDLKDQRAIQSLLDLTFSKTNRVVEAAREALAQIGTISGLTDFLNFCDVLSKTKNADEIEKIKRDINELGEVPTDLICQLLKSSKNEELRAAAAAIIGWREIYEAIDNLIDTLEKDNSSLVRTKTCEALIFANEKGINPLISYLADQDTSVRKAASKSLITINRPLECVEALFNPSSIIRLGIAEVFQEIRSSDILESLREAVQKEQERSVLNAFILTMGSPRDSAAINDILPFVENSIAGTRAAAVQALGEIADESTIVILIKVLDDKESEVIEKASEALKAIGKYSEELNDVIMAIQALRLPDGYKNTEKISIIVNNKSISLHHLHQILEQKLENLNLRRGVYVVLGEIADPESEEHLFNALAEEDAIIRITIARAFTKYDQEKIIGRMIPLLDSSEESIRWGVAETFTLIADEETRQVIEDRLVPKTEESSNIRMAFCRALGTIGNQNSASCLIYVLSDEEPLVRIEAALSLGSIGNPIAFIPLFEREEDANQEVRERVTKVLNQLGETCNIQHIIDNFREFRNDTEEMRLNAAITLADFKEETSSYLKEGLSSKNPLTREGCCNALGQQKFTPARPILETLTEDEEDSVRIAAIRALEQIGDPQSAKILVSRLADKETREKGEEIWNTAILALVSLNHIHPMLKKAHDPDRSIRWGILRALGILKTGIVVILSLIEDTDEQVRIQAAISCGQLKDTTAVKPLIKHLATDSSIEVRINAANSLGQIKDIEATFALLESEEQENVEVVAASSKALDSLGTSPEEKELVTLLRALKNDEEEIRNTTISQVIKVEESKIFLRQFLSATNLYLRASSAYALGLFKDEKSASKIRNLLSDEEVLVRAGSAKALGILTDVDAISLLITHLQDKKEKIEIRELCSDSLASIGSPSVNMLVESLSHDSKTVRRLSALALEKIADPESREPLINSGLRDKDEEVRQTAVRALIRIGEPVVMDISAIQDDNKRYARMAAVEVLGEIGSVQAMRKLEVALNDGDALVRESAGSKLEKIGLEAIKSLCRCLASPRKETARMAAKILLNLSPTMREKGESHAIRFLRSVLKKRDKELQATACEALGILGDKNAVEDLVNMLGSRHEQVRFSAVNALGIMQDGRAIPPLELMLNDKSVEVRIAATEALEQLDKKGIEAQVVDGLTDYVKSSGIGGMVRKAVSDRRGKIMESVPSDLEEAGLEGVIAKGVELTSEAMEKTTKERESPIEKLVDPMDKLQQLENLHSQGILTEEEFTKGQESAVEDIKEAVENLPFSELNSEEIGSILKQLTELNNKNLLPPEDFEPLRSLLVNKLIS